MNRFLVPQFIDVEDKIIGPITTFQFVMMIVAGLWLVLAYKLFDVTLFVLVALLTFGIVGVFGFYKVNGQRFHKFLISVLIMTAKPNLRVWNKLDTITVESSEDEADEIPRKIPPKKTLSRTRLAELSLRVDTGGVYHGEEDDENNANIKNQISK